MNVRIIWGEGVGERVASVGIEGDQRARSRRIGGRGERSAQGRRIVGSPGDDKACRGRDCRHAVANAIGDGDGGGLSNRVKVGSRLFSALNAIKEVSPVI